MTLTSSLDLSLLLPPVMERLTKNRLENHALTAWRSIVLNVVLSLLIYGCVDERLCLSADVYVDADLSQRSHSAGLFSIFVW